MEITIDYDKDKDIVIATPVAEINQENIKSGVLETLKIAKQHRCFYLLLDMRKCQIGQSLMEGFLTMRNMNQTLGLSYEYKVAVVYNPASYPDDRANFIQTIVRNRANPPFRMFRELKDALVWIKELQANASKNNIKSKS